MGHIYYIEVTAEQPKLNINRYFCVWLKCVCVRLSYEKFSERTEFLSTAGLGIILSNTEREKIIQRKCINQNSANRKQLLQQSQNQYFFICNKKCNKLQLNIS